MWLYPCVDAYVGMGSTSGQVSASFPKWVHPCDEFKEDRVGISSGSPGNLMQTHTHEQCGPEQEVIATEGQAESDSPDPQKPHTMDKPGSKPGQEPGARSQGTF